MTILHYIDNEVPWTAGPTSLGEWSSRVQAGGGSIIRSAVAAYPAGVGFGLRQSGGPAYVTKSGLAAACAPGGQLWLGLWFNQRAETAGDWDTTFCYLSHGASSFLGIYPLASSHSWCIVLWDDLGGLLAPGSFAVAAGWHYLAMGWQRATAAGAADGWFRLCLDGAVQVEQAGIRNFNICASLDAMLLGQGSTSAVFEVDLDEVVVADGMPTGGLSRYHLYRSPAGGGRVDIDFTAPVATIPPGPAARQITGLGHAANRDYWYGLRAVSDGGVEEQNTHVRALARLDSAGRLLPPMVAPGDVTAMRRQDGAVIVGFSYRAADNWPCPDAFDIFTDGGTGMLDLDNALVSIPGLQGRREYEAIISPTAPPAMFAVRPRIGSTLGPISRAVTVAVAEPQQPIPF